jgi:hypothetical protein
MSRSKQAREIEQESRTGARLTFVEVSKPILKGENTPTDRHTDKQIGVLVKSVPDKNIGSATLSNCSHCGNPILLVNTESWLMLETPGIATSSYLCKITTHK